MSRGRIKLQILPDGRVEAEIDGIFGKGCMKLIPLIEQLIGGETLDSRRTDEYFQEGSTVSKVSEAEQVQLKGKF